MFRNKILEHEKRRKKMKKGKRALFLVLVFALCSLALFASGSAESASASSASSSEPIELVYLSHYGQSPAFVQAFADSVNLAAKNLGYDNVTCRAEVIEYSGYEAKYITGFSSSNGPDFFLGRPGDWALDGGKNPIALPLDDAATKAWDESLAAAFVRDGYFNGTRYGFPSEGGSLQMLYINADAMREAGLDPEKDIPKTLDELYDLAVKLTKRDASGKITRSGFQPRYLGGGDGVNGKFMPYFHNFGARVLSEDLTTAQGYINSTVSKNAYSWFKSLVDETANLEFGAPETAFQSGQAAIINREAWFARDTLDKAPNIDFIVVPFPAGPDGTDLAPRAGGASWCNMISAKTKYPELCQEIMAELAKPIYDVTLHEPADYPPVCTETMQMDNEYFGPQPYAEAVLAMISKPASPTYDAIADWGSIAAMCGDSLAAIIGGSNVNSELDALAVRIDQLLKQNN